MSWYHDESHQAQAYQQVMQAEHSHHKSHLSHEVIAAAASYEAMKAYQKHCEKNGKPPSHAQAKEILAALSGAFIDHIVETKGLDFIDRQKAKHHANEQLHSASEREYEDHHRHERHELEGLALAHHEFERHEPEHERGHDHHHGHEHHHFR